MRNPSRDNLYENLRNDGLHTVHTLPCLNKHRACICVREVGNVLSGPGGLRSIPKRALLPGGQYVCLVLLSRQHRQHRQSGDTPVWSDPPFSTSYLAAISLSTPAGAWKGDGKAQGRIGANQCREAHSSSPVHAGTMIVPSHGRTGAQPES